MTDETQRPNDTDLQRDWRSRLIMQSCANCKFYIRRGQSNSGNCKNEKSHNFRRQMFKDDVCGEWQA